MKFINLSYRILVTALTVMPLISEAQVKITDGAVLTMNPNSLLELESTNKGLLIPRVAINSLILPAPLTAPVPAGMIVYSLGGAVTDGFYNWSGTTWIPFTTGIGGQWITNGTDIYYNTGNVGIGATVPAEKLEVIGNIKIGDATTGTIRATKELVLRQDGDVYGPSILRLRNRDTENGAIFETTDPNFILVDFIFKNALHQRNIRLESRATFAKTGAPSFHLGGLSPDNPTLSLGDNYAAFSKNVRIGDYTTPLTALDVNGQITLRTGASARALLVSDANGTGTWTSISGVYDIPVTKSTSATLLKTETVILASGNITLTLPAVTSADDGLEITVKNVGTYTDLITVVPEATKMIDNDTTSLLTRWVGRTYVASGSNWIEKNKDTRPDNQYEVSQLGSFITIAEVVAFLNAHIKGPSLVKMGGGTYQIDATQTINRPYPVTFEGLSTGATTITAGAGVSGSPLFNCQTACSFKMLTFMTFAGGAGNDALRLPNSGTYHEILNCTFYNFNKAIVSTSNHSNILVFTTAFVNCAGAGIEMAEGAASNGILAVDNCFFSRCAKGIHLLSGVSQSISIKGSTFSNTAAGTDIGILYVPATLTSFKSLFIINNIWNGQGTYIIGFDFTRADGRDANAYVENNAGEGDKNPHCNINVVNNALTTTCTTANTWYKINWANTSSYTTKLLLNDNQITYQSTYPRNLTFFISGNLSVGSNNRNITIGLVKNGATGTLYGETALRITTANQPFQFSTIVHLSNVVKGDFFEFYCSSNNSGDIARFQDINILVDSK